MKLSCRHSKIAKTNWWLKGIGPTLRSWLHLETLMPWSSSFGRYLIQIEVAISTLKRLRYLSKLCSAVLWGHHFPPRDSNNCSMRLIQMAPEWSRNQKWKSWYYRSWKTRKSRSWSNRFRMSLPITLRWAQAKNQESCLHCPKNQ